MHVLAGSVESVNSVESHTPQDYMVTDLCLSCQKVESNPDAVSSDHEGTLPKVCTYDTDTDGDCVAMNVVMEKLCHESNMQREIVTYAALNSMSSTCFLSNSVYQALGIEGKSTEITIKTTNDESKHVHLSREVLLNVHTVFLDLFSLMFVD